MHQHSEKIEPKKLAITIIITLLFFGYVLYWRKNNPPKNEVKNATSTEIQVEEKE